MIYWFTGQPGSGKTTLALALKARLRPLGRTVFHLDGEDLRTITGNTDYSEAGRRKNIAAAQALAAKMSAEGIVVIASFVSPYREQREDFKQREHVVEIYVHTQRFRGREKHFVPDYQPPLNNFVDIDTTEAPIEDCVRKILALRSTTTE